MFGCLSLRAGKEKRVRGRRTTPPSTHKKYAEFGPLEYTQLQKKKTSTLSLSIHTGRKQDGGGDSPHLRRRAFFLGGGPSYTIPHLNVMEVPKAEATLCSFATLKHSRTLGSKCAEKSSFPSVAEVLRLPVGR